ncbi:MAG: SufE family protein [Pseudomonadota bacterium]
MMQDFQTIADDFAFLDDWDDRYKYLIDLGRSLDPYPEDHRDDAHKVRGCASQVWLTHTVQEDPDGTKTIRLFADSDAHIVRGLVALVLSLYSGKTPAAMANIDAIDALKPLDLHDHLTPQRSNGLSAMIKSVNALADTHNN